MIPKKVSVRESTATTVTEFDTPPTSQLINKTAVAESTAITRYSVINFYLYSSAIDFGDADLIFNREIGPTNF